MARLSEDAMERIALTKEQKEDAVGSLQSYLHDEMEIEAGQLAANLLLRHILREIGPNIYNAGLRDASIVMRQHADDLAEIELLPPHNPFIRSDPS